MEGESTKEGLAREMKERVRASSAGLEDAARERARLLYWPGLKSILEAIVCNSDEKAAR